MSYSSYAEYLRLPAFRRVCEQVRNRSKGNCEKCGHRSATEVHHVAYCKWGEVDTKENLMHVCHKCHCDLHRCSVCHKVTLKSGEIKRKLDICKECMDND